LTAWSGIVNREGRRFGFAAIEYESALDDFTKFTLERSA
jgi:hypothetical protein